MLKLVSFLILTIFMLALAAVGITLMVTGIWDWIKFKRRK